MLNTKLLIETGMSGTTGNWYCGLQEHREMGFVLHALRKGDLFADIGANIGSFTVLAAGVCGANVISVEPVPSTFEKLITNIRINNLNKVDAHNVGISSQVGELHFTTEQGTANHVARPDERGPTVSVNVTTLDALCAERIPTVMKIDVEGHEFAVMQGGSRIFQSPNLIAVLMENGLGGVLGVSDEVIHSRMRQWGFEPRTYDPVRRTLLPQSSLAGNSIFVRDEIALNARLREAPTYKLVNRDI